MESCKVVTRLGSLFFVLSFASILATGYIVHPVLLSFALGIPSQPPVLGASTSQWFAYTNRYAAIIMGGDETGQMYTWYWQDSYGMYQYLITIGFKAEDVYFLSYGSDANDHPEAVDRVSTKANVQWAFEQARIRSTIEDLVYVFWVDHGTDQLFNLHERTTMTHLEYANSLGNISARAIVGAYNPCYSGAIIGKISRLGVISATSVNAQQPNSAGWAGWWRTALEGGTSSDPSDRNWDGHVDMTEAYEWVAPKSQDYRPTAEHPLFDDNGDGTGSEYKTAGYDSDDPNKDGFRGRMYSLGGWRSNIDGTATASTVKTTSNHFTGNSNFSFSFEALVSVILLPVSLILVLLLARRLRPRSRSHMDRPAVRYCNCGNRLLVDAVFCHSCGSKQN